MHQIKGDLVRISLSAACDPGGHLRSIRFTLKIFIIVNLMHIVPTGQTPPVIDAGSASKLSRGIQEKACDGRSRPGLCPNSAIFGPGACHGSCIWAY